MTEEDEQEDFSDVTLILDRGETTNNLYWTFAPTSNNTYDTTGDKTGEKSH